MATLCNLKRPLHWNLAHADHTVPGCRSGRWWRGGLAGSCPRHTASEHFFATAPRVFDTEDRGGVEKGGSNPQRDGLPALAFAAPQAIVEGW